MGGISNSSAPSSYSGPSSYGAPSSSGSAKAHAPYASSGQSGDNLQVKSTSGIWGYQGGTNNASSNVGNGGQYNITNNSSQVINYNYSPNIQAISSQDGPVPTFHELDKNKRKNQPSGNSSASGAGIGQAIGSIGSSTYVTNATKAVQESTYLASASDTIKRTVGVDIRAAIGGKSLAESAEERLRKDMEGSGPGYGGYRGSYQGIQIPTDSGPSGSSYRNPTSGYQPTQIKATSSNRWQAEAQKQIEEKEKQTTEKAKALFGGSQSRGKRLDDDSDEESGSIPQRET